MRLDAKIVTWTAYDRQTGAPVLVDDRTFNPEYHSRHWPEEARASGAAEVSVSGPKITRRGKGA